MEVNLNHLGRALSIYPAEVGQQFENHCTVEVSNRLPASADTGWRPVYETEAERVFWVDTDSSDRRYWCTFAGYFSHIFQQLTAKYGAGLQVNYQVDDGLGQPDIEYLRHVAWRRGQRSVVSAMLAHRGGQILCDVGFGKSFILGRLARAFPQSKLAIVAPAVSIVREIYADISTDVGDVGQVGGGRSNPARVTVAVSNSMRYIPTDISLLLVDEAHRILTPSYISQLNRFHRARMFALTATPEGRGDNRDGYLEAIYGPVLCDVTYQESVKNGNVVPLEVVVYPVINGPDVSGITDDTRRNRLGIWRNEQRNTAIARAVREQITEYGEGVQILVMVERTEHALLLARLLPEFEVVHGTVDAQRRERLTKDGIILPDQRLCSAREIDERKQRFSRHELRRAICTKVWSTGVNFPDLQVLVRGDAAASMIDSGQIPGRLSRLAVETNKQVGRLVDFSDAFCKTFERRWQKRARVYRDRGWKIIKG